jgi:hypothetical protein
MSLALWGVTAGCERRPTAAGQPAPAGPPTPDTAFLAAAQQVVNALARGDVRKVMEAAAAGGILVVRRECDWDNKGEDYALPKGNPEIDDSYLYG